MFNLLKKISFRSFVELIKNIFRRFPLPAIFSIMAFSIFIYVIRFNSELSQSTEEILMKVFVTFAISFFFGIAWYLYTESRAVESPRKHYYQFITLIFAALFYFFFDEGLFSSFQAETVVYIILTIIGVTAFLFIAKYFQKYKLRIESQREFYVWSYDLIIKLIMAVIVGVVVMLLGFIALTSIFTLFDIKFLDDHNWYGYWSVFSLVLFAPFFFLANFPQVKQELKSITEVSDNKFYFFLINFIGLPAIHIYFIILYSYTLKVLFNFSEWPQGEVTWMVILFSFFGYLIYFASFAFSDAFKHAKIFRKTLPYAVLLQTPMLFYAIGLRINQYDLTINRYLVVVFGFWLLYLSLYYIISKHKDLSVSFYSLLVVVIFMSIGPWSVYLVPKLRQLSRLEDNLTRANILQGSVIVPLESARDIDAKLSGEIYGSISYLANYHGWETFEGLFKVEIDEILRDDKLEWEKNKQERLERARENNNEELIKIIEEDKYNGISNRKLVNDLTKKIKVERWNSFQNYRDEQEYLRFENDNSLNNFNPSIKVSGYDYYLELSHSGFENNLKEGTNNQYYTTIDSRAGKLRIYLSKNILEEIDINDIILQKILNSKDKYIEPKNYVPGLKALLPAEAMTFDIIGKNFDIKVNLRSISIKNPDWKEGESKEAGGSAVRTIRPNFIYADGYVLLRKKTKDITN